MVYRSNIHRGRRPGTLAFRATDSPGRTNNITLHYHTLRYIALHYMTLHYHTLRYIALHYMTLHYHTLRYIA